MLRLLKQFITMFLAIIALKHIFKIDNFVKILSTPKYSISNRILNYRETRTE